MPPPRADRSVAAMTQLTSRDATAIVAGAAAVTAITVSPVGDQGFFAIALLGPFLTGLAFGLRHASLRVAVGVWVLCGLGWLVYDWIVNGEDRLFHLVLTAIMAGLVWAGAGLGRLLSRGPRAAAPPRR
jgi:hypothetical protein